MPNQAGVVMQSKCKKPALDTMSRQTVENRRWWLSFRSHENEYMLTNL